MLGAEEGDTAHMGHGCSAHYDYTHRSFVHHAQKAGAVLLICLAIWAITGFGGTWPMWVALGLVIKLAIYAQGVYGRRGGGDSDSDDEPAAEDDFVIV